MSWVKLEDGFFNNRKIVSVSKDAKLVYLAGLCYAGGALTDGLIPGNAVAILAAQCDVKSAAKVAKELVAAGLWHEEDGGYQVHDYLEHNESSQNVRAKQDAARERMQRNRSQNVRANKQRTSREVRLPDTDIDTDTELTTTNVVVGAQAPETPSGDSESKSETKPNRATQIMPDWDPGDGLRRWAESEGFQPGDIEREVPQFIDFHRSRGETRKDWDAGFRTWMRNAKKWGHTFAQDPRKQKQPQNMQTAGDEHRFDDAFYAGEYASKATG